jgi:flagella basal body P-ring formation protein FlgA
VPAVEAPRPGPSADSFSFGQFGAADAGPESTDKSEAAVAPAAPQPAAIPSTQPAPKTPAATVAGRIQEQLLEQLVARPEELTVTFAAANRDLAAAPICGPTSITSTDRNLLGRRTWRVDMQQNGRTSQRYVTATVRLMRPAVVARRALAPGTTITASDVESVAREDDGRQDRMASTEVIVGQQVRRALAAGQVIAAGDLKSPLLVARGQLAWVQAGCVQVRARAMSQGSEGEVVEFENLQSKGRLWAQVTGPGAAQVAAAGKAN